MTRIEEIVVALFASKVATTVMITRACVLVFAMMLVVVTFDLHDVLVKTMLAIPDHESMQAIRTQTS